MEAASSSETSVTCTSLRDVMYNNRLRTDAASCYRRLLFLFMYVCINPFIANELTYGAMNIIVLVGGPLAFGSYILHS